MLKKESPLVKSQPNQQPLPPKDKDSKPNNLALATHQKGGRRVVPPANREQGVQITSSYQRRSPITSPTSGTGMTCTPHPLTGLYIDLKL